MKTESFIRPDGYDRVIIAMKGLPCTGKTRVAYKIGDWAERPVLYIDDFIETPSDTNNNNDDEADSFQARPLEQAFSRLCRVACRQLNSGFRCVVIKSSLSSIFELEQLFELVRRDEGQMVLLIVECQVRNKHQWQRSFSGYQRKWYRPRRWNDIEKAIDDHYNHPQALAQWDHHLLHLIKVQQSNIYGPPFVSRLVVDPSYDLDLKGYTNNVEINPIFAHAINHLVSSSLRGLNGQNPYIVEFDELPQSRASEILNASMPSTRRKDVCGARGCLFKYKKEELNIQVDADDCYCYCGVCEEKLVSGEPAYTCHYCFFTLHIPCAHLHMSTSHSNFPNILEYLFIMLYIGKLPASEKHACKGCTKKQGGFNEFCSPCWFQTVLKGRKLPLVVNHEHHPHPLSLRIQEKSFACKACGVEGYYCSYVCGICEWYYHLQCVSMPGEVLKHEHGGHEHVLELKHSHDDTEQEDYWCDVCFQDLDPYFQYYSCKSCPYYAAHLCCAGVYPRDTWPQLL